MIPPGPSTPTPSPDDAARLLIDAMRMLEPDANASDEELAAVAERGIGAIPARDRDRVLGAIAADRDGASAAFVVADLLDHEQREERGADAPGHSLRLVVDSPSHGAMSRPSGLRLVRVTGPLWAAAACATLAFGVLFVNSTPSGSGVGGGYPVGPEWDRGSESVGRPALDPGPDSPTRAAGRPNSLRVGLIVSGAVCGALTPPLLVGLSRLRKRDRSGAS